MVLRDHVKKYNHYICTTPMPMAAKISRMVTYLERLVSMKLRGFVRLRGKVKSLDIHYHNLYCYQTWKGGNRQWGISFHKVTRLLDHVLLQVHLEYWYCYISTTARPIATKLGKVVTYYESFSPIKPHKPLNTWSCKVTW